MIKGCAAAIYVPEKDISNAKLLACEAFHTSDTTDPHLMIYAFQGRYIPGLHDLHDLAA